MQSLWALKFRVCMLLKSAISNIFSYLISEACLSQLISMKIFICLKEKKTNISSLLLDSVSCTLLYQGFHHIPCRTQDD